MSTPLDDPWASGDHDPLHTPQPLTRPALITTGQALLLARADIADAVAHTGETRRAYALSAAEYAEAVLHAGDATAAQREMATYYQADAEILAHT
jgi:hypothetical protein